MTHRVEVHEHERAPVPDEVVEAVPEEFWKSAECEVSKSAAAGAWYVRAGNSVGVSRIRTAVGDVTLQIRPKLETADVFFMADYAYEQRHEPLRLLQHEDIGLEAVLRDPTACLLVWHARAIRRFAARWLRRDYQAKTRVLDGKVKGRILVNRYVTGHLAVGDAARIPCRLQERTLDTPNNRVLKAGLRYIAAHSHDLPVPAARHAVLREVKAALPLFAQVTDTRLSASDIRATSSRGSQRHYESVLKATISLLQSRLMGEELTDPSATSAFMWRMPVLFQESVRGLISSTPGLVLDEGRRGTARIYDADGNRRRSSKVDPDLVLRVDDDRTVLIDTKYKDALPSQHEADDEALTTVADRHRIRVTRTDIYQIVAYRQHEKWPNSTGALLYPLVLAEGDQLPSPMEVRGFGAAVTLMFIDIGRNATTNLPAFREVLREHADAAPLGPPPSAPTRPTGLRSPATTLGATG